MKNRTGNSTQGHLTLTFPCQSPKVPSALRRKRATIVPYLFAMIVAAGCATTNVSNRQQLVTGQLPRPNHIWVYDFAATAADVPANATIAGQYSATPQTAQQVAVGRQLGAQIAAELVQQIQSMGLPAAQGGAGTMPQINDIIIQGYLLSVNQGNEAERLAIGFGAGASELRTAVEGYQMTAQGPRKLGSGTVDSGGSKGPGAAVGVAGLIATGNPAGLIISTGMKVYGEESGSSKVEGRAKQTAKEIADVLKQRFQQQGWIQ
jgi:Domain of unknown function (DUF4410)